MTSKDLDGVEHKCVDVNDLNKLWSRHKCPVMIS